MPKTNITVITVDTLQKRIESIEAAIAELRLMLESRPDVHRPRKSKAKLTDEQRLLRRREFAVKARAARWKKS